MRQLLTTKQLAAKWKLKPNTLERWRIAGEGPPFVKIGAAVRYDDEDADEWTNTRRKRSTSASKI